MKLQVLENDELPVIDGLDRTYEELKPVCTAYDLSAFPSLDRTYEELKQKDADRRDLWDEYV